MEKATFDLLAEPMGDLYCELLDFAVSECGLALVVIHRMSPLSDHGSAVISQLRPFLRSKDECDKWPGTELGPGAEPASVLRYRYGPECAAVLKQATNRLYGWVQPGLPEDLCLLRDDDSPWLVTLVHDHDGYLCLSSEEKARLVAAVPRITPRLRDSRGREESLPATREVMRLLVAWDPYDYYGGSPEDDAGTEAQSILYALSSAEVKSEAELTTYIADMYDRWHGMYDSFTPDTCAGVAQTIWAWWEERKGTPASE
jgi:hypothetical protein